ncbi:MAG TPA: redoxin domain-containing protein [Gaiellaceae bacterium]|nr:redoxin domain-containing protein [Gaiellaceae bacterium]
MSKQSRRPNRAARHQVPPVGRKPAGRRRTNVAIGVGVAAVVIALVAAATMFGGSTKSDENRPLTVGQKAPAFAGENVLTGEELTSAGLKGKNVLYYFSEGVMCQACLVQIQALEKHVRHLDRRGLTLVSITNDDVETLRQAAVDYKVTTPLIADASRTMTLRFGALGGGMHSNTADHMFILVDKTGVVRYAKDYPSMWIDPDTLIEGLPRL